MPNAKPRVSLLTNIISPARLALYSGLAEHFDLQILHGGTERNRGAWEGSNKSLPHARVVRAWGWQFRIPRKRGLRSFDHRYVHITPGYAHHLLSFRPDAVITNEMGFRTLIALAYGGLFRKPVWVWWGGTLHTERGAGRVRKLLRSAICRWTRHWISYGNTSTEYLESLGIRPDLIVEIQNAVDERLFTVETHADLDIRPRPVLLFVGQLIMRKGVEELLKAAAALQRAGRVFSLLLVGSGPDQSSLEALVKTLDLRNVRFVPAQKPVRMPAIYQSADAFVLPTLEDVWGLVVNEAILTGLPVLCSKYAGCAQEIVLAENIFDPANSKEFEHKLEKAIDGRLAKSDRSRLKTTLQLVDELVRNLKSSMRAANGTVPGAAQHGLYEQ